MLYVEIASADDVKKPKNNKSTKDSKHWNCIVVAETAEQTLDKLIELANNEGFSIENNWLRVREIAS